MRRVMVALVASMFIAAPSAQAAKPSVSFARKTLTRSAAGQRIKTLPRGKALQFDVRYVVRNVPARWRNADARVFVTLSRGSDVLRLRTNPAATETGSWRWVVKGAQVRIPVTYPAGRYTVRVRVEIRHAGTRVARASHAWRATVR
jgi:hypothetical protein